LTDVGCGWTTGCVLEVGGARCANVTGGALLEGGASFTGRTICKGGATVVGGRGVGGATVVAGVTGTGVSLNGLTVSGACAADWTGRGAGAVIAMGLALAIDAPGALIATAAANPLGDRGIRTPSPYDTPGILSRPVRTL
jgi:hypothetical protein